MKKLKAVFVVLTLSLFMVSISSCREKTTSEKIEDGVEEVGEELEEAGEDIIEEVEDAADDN